METDLLKDWTRDSVSCIRVDTVAVPRIEIGDIRSGPGSAVTFQQGYPRSGRAGIATRSLKAAATPPMTTGPAGKPAYPTAATDAIAGPARSGAYGGGRTWSHSR